MKVWLVTFGEGDDGDAWDVHSIHSTKEKAEAVRARLSESSAYRLPFRVEEWEVDSELDHVCTAK